jgi:hypothetical protein
MSIADSTLRSVGSEGGRAYTASAWGAVDAHWAIATQVVAPAIAACSEQQDRSQTVTTTPSATRIGDALQCSDQADRLGRRQRLGGRAHGLQHGGQDRRGRWDRGHGPSRW